MVAKRTQRGFQKGDREGTSGFTLVEVLVAAFMLGICVGGFCTLAVIARETSDKARARYTAVNLAKNRLERARIFGFDQLGGFVENQVVVDRNGNPSSAGDYRRTTTVRAVTSNLVEVVVTVEIRDRIARSFGKEAETVKSYVAKYVSRP